jgi:ERCC4-type nuclease
MTIVPFLLVCKKITSDRNRQKANMSSIDCRLIVDYREKRVVPEEECASCELAALPVGDFCIRETLQESSSERDLVLIERKTVADMAASIKDGRYRDQKARLLASSAVMLVYLVEGEIPKTSSVNGISSDALVTVINKLFVHDKLRLVQTRDAADTWRFVKNLTMRINDGRVQIEYSKNERETKPGAYVHATKIRKCENLDSPHTIAIMQLAVLPHVSTRIAEAILQGADGASSMADLVDFLRRGNAISFIANLSLPMEGKRTRRLGVSLGTRVVQSLGLG